MGAKWQPSGTHNRTCAQAATTSATRWAPYPPAGGITCKPPPPPPSPPALCASWGAGYSFCGAPNDRTWYNCCSAGEVCYAPARRCCDAATKGYECTSSLSPGDSTTCACDEECITSALGAGCYPAGSYLCGSEGVCSAGQQCDDMTLGGAGLCCDAGQALCGDRCCERGWRCASKKELDAWPYVEGTCARAAGGPPAPAP